MWQSLWKRSHEFIQSPITNCGTLEPLDLIRLNGKVDYDADLGKHTSEFYVDDNFPNEFYYG